MGYCDPTTYWQCHHGLPLFGDTTNNNMIIVGLLVISLWFTGLLVMLPIRMVNYWYYHISVRQTEWDYDTVITCNYGKIS